MTPQVKTVLVISQHSAIIDSEVKYGALRATIEISKYLASRNKFQVYVAGLSKSRSGFVNDSMETITYILQSTSEELIFFIRKNIKNVDVLVQISDLSYIKHVTAKKYIIYHHNPSFINIGKTPATSIINLFRIPIICVSNYSLCQQINSGIDKKLINVLANGYDSSKFFFEESTFRHSFSLVFAGNICDYKGIDIALVAFIKIKEIYCDATFSICGNNHSWANVSSHYFKQEWLDPEGFPIWSNIEKDIPGVSYLGELSQSDLAKEFRKHSLLITPSRIGETFGLVSIEAQACGCLPILPNKGGFPETLQDAQTGYLYEDNTPESLANTIINLWKQNLPNEEQRLEAQAWIKENFDWQITGEKFCKIIENSPEQKISPILVDILCFLMQVQHYLIYHVKNINRLYSQGLLMKKIVYKILQLRTVK